MNGDVHLNLSEFGKALGMKNIRDSVYKLDVGRCVEKIYIPHPQSKTKKLEVSYINFRGAQALARASTKPMAKEWVNWMDGVTEQVSKTG